MSLRSPPSYTHRPLLTLRLVRKCSRAQSVFPINSFVCDFVQIDVFTYKRAQSQGRKADLGHFRRFRRFRRFRARCG